MKSSLCALLAGLSLVSCNEQLIGKASKQMELRETPVEIADVHERTYILPESCERIIEVKEINTDGSYKWASVAYVTCQNKDGTYSLFSTTVNNTGGEWHILNFKVKGK